MKEEFIPKTKKPYDYLSGYQRRMEKNDWELKQLAKEVIKDDPEVEVYFNEDERSYQNGVIFFKGEDINTIQFHEVPYHWSGCGYESHSEGENVSMPFDVNDVLNNFKSIKTVLERQPNEYYKSKEQYLKWYSFLKRWKG